MSYILDALKRADADRERGAVPNLRTPTQHRAGVEAEHEPPAFSQPARSKWWIALAVLLAAAVPGTWLLLRQPTPASDAVPTAANADATNTAPSTSMQPAPAADEPALVQADSLDGLGQTDKPGPEQNPEPILTPRPAPPVPKPPAATPAPEPSTAEAPPPPPVPPAPAASAAPANAPPLKVSGTTYSQNPALRMLIANGKVVQEGQEVEPGLKLEVIGPRSAVFNFQGSRYNVNY